MNKFFLTVATAFFALAFLFSTAGSTLAQRTSDLSTGFAPELRPFDFSNKYYEDNGIFADMLVDRRNGADGQSVFDFTSDQIYSNVRITATMPAYSGGGEIVFWNYYAGVPSYAFVSENKSGEEALTAAHSYPLYVFPSATSKSKNRQSALITIDENYAAKNPLGVAVVIVVDFTDKIFTRAGQMAMNALIAENGASLDGTPVIKTTKQLQNLTDHGYVRQRYAVDGSDRTPYAVAKVLQYPENGSITPDAFLVYVKNDDGQALAAEKKIISYFECLQKGDSLCF
jgi:hypothetical protein